MTDNRKKTDPLNYASPTELGHLRKRESIRFALGVFITVGAAWGLLVVIIVLAFAGEGKGEDLSPVIPLALIMLTAAAIVTPAAVLWRQGSRGFGCGALIGLATAMLIMGLCAITTH